MLNRIRTIPFSLGSLSLGLVMLLSAYWLTHAWVSTDYSPESTNSPSPSISIIKGTIHHSFSQAARAAGLSTHTIADITHIFSGEINFSRDLHPGDRFAIQFGRDAAQHRIIVGASFHLKHHDYQAIRFKNLNGQINYYNPKGDNLKVGITRKPVRKAYISSGFTHRRFHPVLGYARPHLGVDWAANSGSKIHATGSGVVTRIGRYGGYGNMITIKHNYKYTTIYAHMRHFAKGLHRGSHIKPDQIIGYVGQTGLATGPHCHYEIRVFGVPHNPMTVKLPRAAPIAASQRKAFAKRVKALSTVLA
ncbi:MAG: hypothetical protein DHS20C10_10230 [marine bacterium B5-7]|nr:MAG: hypothetical protein DHS20C10_10230 [marine bacterium B5-7]